MATVHTPWHGEELLMKHVTKSLPALGRVLCALALCLFVSGCEQPAGPIAEMPPEDAPPAPDKPQLLVEHQSLGVIWNTVLIAESYTVYYGTTAKPADAVAWTGEITLDAGTANAFITGLENEQRYFVWVTASNSGGESPKSPAAIGTPVNSATIQPHIFFDYGWMIPSYEEAARFYTVPQSGTLVLSPVRWRIGAGATYTWKVNTVEQSGGLSGQGNRYFTFTPAGTGTYTVDVTVRDGSAEYTATTQVVCTSPYAVREKT